MYLNGGSLQGFVYGDLSPLDYTGLAAWYRATDGVELLRGSTISRWRDISGNGRHLTRMDNQGGAATGTVNMIVKSTSYGLAVGQVNATTGLGNLSSDPWHKFIMDGTPFTILVISRTGSNVGSAPNTTVAGAILNGAGTFTIGAQSNSNMPVRWNNHASIDYFGYLAANQNNVYALNCYGYNNGYNPDMKFFINGTVRTSGNYTSSPVGVIPRGYLWLNPNLSNLYEVIIYNQAGKSQLQIEFEVGNLLEIYIKKRYKNFIS